MDAKHEQALTHTLGMAMVYVSILEERLSEHEINEARNELEQIQGNACMMMGVMGVGQPTLQRGPEEWQ